MGVALLDDTVLTNSNIPYDVAKYQFLCSEFGISEHGDFRYRDGPNYGLGYAYIYVTNRGPLRQKSTAKTMAMTSSMIMTNISIY